MLFLLTAIWGSTFVVLQSALDSISPFVLIASRFALAALTLVAIGAVPLAAAVRAIPAALPLSLSMLAGFGLQTIGLQTTTPARSAFLTSLSILLVPPIEFVLVRRRPRAMLLLAVGLAAAGVYLLFRPIGAEWRRGDSLTVIAAVTFAYYIVELARQSRRLDAATLVLSQSLTIAAIAVPLALWFETPRFVPDPGAILGLVYLAIACTAFTFFLMTWAQARVEPLEAAVIYTLEPVVAALFSVALGREPLGFKLVAGGSLIIAAMLTSGIGARES
jgi:drug/metabolite transporter (DMT)-like permease